MQNIVQKKTACTRDCPDACGLLVTIDNGRVVRLQGDPDHPITQGFICQRTSRFLDRQYSRHRLQKPLWRRNKGDDFEEIEWKQALDLLAEKMSWYSRRMSGNSRGYSSCFVATWSLSLSTLKPSARAVVAPSSGKQDHQSSPSSYERMPMSAACIQSHLTMVQLKCNTSRSLRLSQ